MAGRSQRLPSLNGLRVFWTAARHGSFVKAASELDVTPAFQRLQDSFAALNESAHGGSMLTVSAAPSFATKWLLPRLSKFLAANPEIEVSLKATVELADFERSEADIGIRYGRGDYPGLETELLLRETVFPVCSPDLIAAGGKALS